MPIHLPSAQTDIALEAIIQLLAESSYAEAIDLAESYLAAHPRAVTALNIAGICAKHLGNHTLAEHYWKKVTESNPMCTDALNNLGNLLHELGRFTESERAYRKAISTEGNFPEAHFNLGNLLRTVERRTEAEAAYIRAIELRPDYADALCNLGALYIDLRRYADAEHVYLAARQLRPADGYILSKLDHIWRKYCEWQRLEQIELSIVKLINAGKSSGLIPFELLAISQLSPKQLRQAACQFADSAYVNTTNAETTPPKAHAKDNHLRIGYLSADFHDHATTRLLIGILEGHDRNKFAVCAYSYGPFRDDAYRQRVETACETFRDIRTLSDIDAAKQISDDSIDILVDLKGYTSGARLGISALRPAPVIVSWLGYPGTLGHPLLADYLISDRYVTPPEHAQYYSETLALMPCCYQPNDSLREIGTRPSRHEAGLPDKGFVFCCFNQNYKFTASMFAIWCRLLQAVQCSVLWLLKPSEPRAIENLKQAAKANGVSHERIIFAPALPPTEHLGRLQLADLALDTYPITSHTTASDALWVGLPLVTRCGESFASRVAASLLNAVGLPELVTTTNDAYHALALSLANNQQQLDNIRRKLHAERKTAPLFDTQRFTRDLERLYDEIWSRQRQGKKDMIALEANESAYDDNKTTPSPTEMQTKRLRVPFQGCPLCGSKEETQIVSIDASSHPYYDKALPADFNWLRCDGCMHVHTEYYWTDAGLEILLKTVHPHQIAGNLDPEMMRKAWAPLVQRAIDLLHLGLPGIEKQVSWLDAGCGDGSLVMTAAEFGFNAIGLDLRPEAVSALTARGYRCHRGDMSAVKVDQPLHVLSMMDLLEHLPNPLLILKRAHELLRPEGLLLLSSPNMTSMSWREMDSRKANPYWGELEHCHNFSRESLIALLRQSGFSTVRYDVSERYKAGMDIVCRRNSQT